MPTVEFQDKTLEFPDGTSEAVMRNSIYDNFPEARPKDYEQQIRSRLGFNAEASPSPDAAALEQAQKPAVRIPQHLRPLMGKAVLGALGPVGQVLGMTTTGEQISAGVGETLSSMIEGTTSPAGAAMLVVAAAQPQALIPDLLNMVRSGGQKLFGGEDIQTRASGLTEAVLGAGGVRGTLLPRSSAAVTARQEPATPPRLPITDEARLITAPSIKMPEFQQGKPVELLPAPGETLRPSVATQTGEAVIAGPGESLSTTTLRDPINLPASPLAPRTAGYRVEVPPFEERPALGQVRPITLEDAKALRGAIEIGKSVSTPEQPFQAPTVKTDLRQLEKIMQRNTIDTLESWADDVIKEKLSSSSANPFFDPEFLVAATVKGAVLVKRGVTDFSKWSEPMLKQFGAGIHPHLPELYKSATAMAKTGPAAVTEKPTTPPSPVTPPAELSAVPIPGVASAGRSLAEEAGSPQGLAYKMSSLFKGVLDAIPTRWFLNYDSPRKPISEFGKRSLGEFLSEASSKNDVFSEASDAINAMTVPATWLGGKGEVTSTPAGAAAGMMASFPVIRVAPTGVPSRVLVHEAAHLYYEMMPQAFRDKWKGIVGDKTLGQFYKDQGGKDSSIQNRLNKMDDQYSQHGLNAAELEMFAISVEAADALRTKGKLSEPSISYYLTPEPKLVELVQELFKQGSKPHSAQTTLVDVYKRFEPEKKKFPSVGEIKSKVVEGVRTGLSSKFRPLDKLAEDVAGTAEPKRVAHIMEQLAGSSGKAEADVYRFDQDVSRVVKSNEKDFNAYLFLRRSIDRLQMDAADIARAAAGEEVPQLNRRQVSDYTIPQLQAKLQLLESNLKPEVKAQFETAADAYQQHMDKALALQVESGRMAPEVYAEIKEGNQFYAPFKLLKYIDESSRPEGSGRKIDTTADYTKAMQGVHDPNFKLGDMLAAARRNLTMSRILADKNMAMQKVAELAKDDPQGVFIRQLGPAGKAARDKSEISVMQDGETVRYEVNKDVADSVKLNNAAAAGLLANVLRAGKSGMQTGAVGLNVAFQPVNLFLADLPSAFLVSKYGVKSPLDLFKASLDWSHAFFTSMQPRFTGKASRLYLDFLDSGAAGTTMLDYLKPEALRFSEKSKLRPGSILNTAFDFGRALEEVNKIFGVKRAMREHAQLTGAALQKNFPEAVTEVRRFSGSPDFPRQGSWTEGALLNLLFPFFNARLQGGIAVVGRLAGRDGLNTALKTNAKVWTTIGLPSALLYLYNNLPQFAKDYASRPDNEKKNYWLFPKSTYITDDQGSKIRDYWKMPKRELGKYIGNSVESAMQFGKENDPAAFWALGMNLLENLSPIAIEGRNTGERIESMVSGLNPVLKAPIELGTGRDTFRHRDIVPDVMKLASPEQQYLERTPALFKRLANIMPDVAPEFVRSPLMLENLTQNFTAGLVTQFLKPEKPVQGREGIAANRFMRRFQAAPYTENAALTTEINTLKREVADEFLVRDRLAKAAVADGKPLEDALNTVKSSGDEKLIRRTIDLWLARQNGITGDERRILSLPVQQRAEFVAGQLKKLDADAKAKLLEDYVRKRILTQDVMEQLAVELEKLTQPQP